MPRSDPLTGVPLDAKPILVRLSKADRRAVEALAKRAPFCDPPFCGELAVVVRTGMRFAMAQMQADPNFVVGKVTVKKDA